MEGVRKEGGKVGKEKWEKGMGGRDGRGGQVRRERQKSEEALERNGKQGRAHIQFFLLCKSCHLFPSPSLPPPSLPPSLPSSLTSPRRLGRHLRDGGLQKILPLAGAGRQDGPGVGRKPAR
jgi:hypothetical protein